MALFVAALVVLFILKVIDVLLLVFLAILLAVYLSAITDWLEHRFGMRRWLGLTLTVTATSREQLDELYRTLSTHPMVKVVL